MGRGSALAAALGACALLVAAPAAGDPRGEKQEVDAGIGALREKIEEAEQESSVLTSEISAASSRVREVQEQVDAEQRQLSGLEAQLASETEKLERLNRLFDGQTEQLRAFAAEHAHAVEQLEQRVREIYMGDAPDLLAFVLGATTFTDLLDNVELLNDIGRQDASIAARVAKAERDTRELRNETARTRADVRTTTREISVQVAEQRSVRDRLVASRDELIAAGAAREQTLALIRADAADHAEELDAMEAESAALAAQIVAAQAAASTAASAESSASSGAPAPLASNTQSVSAGGFIFPVSGPVVSGFGPRGGRLHEGIDIIAAFGTPVVASAAGTVIRSDWGNGYGNVVVIDHGNGLSTTYAHNSSLAVGVGARVTQGTVIAYVGSTGNSSGPHVHLEFRINGTAVDPFGYL
jgi:murein DD-endopeptidase MepM/ murein hydrolase activator NlpD